MRRNLVIFLALIFGVMLNLKAQVVTSTPWFPVVSDSVIVYFDASKGNGALENYSGDIYAHAGVITNLSTSSSDWRYVIADWSTNLPKALLKPLGNNLYKFSIKPTITDFYAVSTQDTVKKLAFVFRNADGSKVGRNSDGSDIMVDVYPEGLKAKVVTPENGVLVAGGTNINFRGVSKQSDTLYLYLNDLLLEKTPLHDLTRPVTVTNPGINWLIAKVTKGDEVEYDSVYVYVRGGVPVADLPAGVIPGINYNSDGSITLVLADPPALKSYVYLLSDLNNYMPDEAYQMNRTLDGKFYWITLNNLPSNSEIGYQYLIDGTLRIADPYCEKILDPWNDSYISSSVYPDLKPYPQGKTSGIVSVFPVTKSEYQWQVTNFSPIAKEKLVIYELHIRDFVSTRAIKTVMDTLDYLQKLGVNAIELMPINEFEGNDSWGYNPAFYFAADKAYGTKNDYKAFIDECHKRGISVFIDMVLNHSYGLSPLVQMYFDAQSGTDGAPSADNPWYNQSCPHPPYCWGYDFNHESDYTKEFIDRVNAYWLTEYNVDGFRFDFTKGFTNKAGDGMAYDASRIAILKRMANQIWSVKPEAVVILEHLTVNTEEKELSAAGMMLWGNMNYNYTQAAMSKISSSNIANISYKSSARNWAEPHLVGYMESHDEERLMYNCLTAGNDSLSSYSIKDQKIALERMALNAAFFLTVPGPKMIWQFGELGYDVSINYDCRVCPKPLHWEYKDDFYRNFLYNVYSTFNKLRMDYPVFSTTDFDVKGTGSVKQIVLRDNSMDVVVVGNFGITNRTASPLFTQDGKWYEFTKNDSIEVTAGSTKIELKAGEFKLYSTSRIVNNGLNIGLEEPIRATEVKLYPNPTNGKINVEVDLNRASSVVFTVYDLSGKMIIQTDRYCQAGVNLVQIQVSNLSPGLYILRGSSNQQQFTSKFSISY